MAYSDSYGLQAHATPIQHITFKDIYWRWLFRNDLSEADLDSISAKFMGLPILIPVPVLELPDVENSEDFILKLKMYKTKWYVARPTNGNVYLISPIEDAHDDKCWIIEKQQDTRDLVLWTGRIRTDKAVLESKVFVLPDSEDVEKLLHCYFQLIEVSKVQVLDLWELPRDQGKDG